MPEADSSYSAVNQEIVAVEFEEPDLTEKVTKENVPAESTTKQNETSTRIATVAEVGG